MAGYLKFAAIILAAGLLAAACSDSGHESAPVASSTPPPPTATQTPLPDGTIAPSSTQGWLTYPSPYGFSIDFPEDWTLESIESNPRSRQGQIVNLMNPAFVEPRPAEAGDLLPPARAVKIEISLVPAIGVSRFDAQALIRRCETQGDPRLDGPPGTGEQTTVAGRPAVICRGTDISFDGEPAPGSFHWIELPGGRTLFIRPAMMEPSAAETDQVDAILASLRFEDAPIDTSAWPTYENESLAFSMRYPPRWMVDEEDLFPPSVLFLNEVAQASQARQEPDGTRDFRSDEDAAWIEIGTPLFVRFGIEAFIENCSETAIGTTFAGLPSTMCGDQYWVERASGEPILVGGYATEAEPRTQQLLDAALATITFRE